MTNHKQQENHEANKADAMRIARERLARFKQDTGFNNGEPDINLVVTAGGNAKDLAAMMLFSTTIEKMEPERVICLTCAFMGVVEKALETMADNLGLPVEALVAIAKALPQRHNLESVKATMNTGERIEREVRRDKPGQSES